MPEISPMAGAVFLALNDDLVKVGVYIVIGGVWLIGALLRKLKGNANQDERSALDTGPVADPAAPPQLTEADRQYRKIQEEIRRKIAERMQGNAGPASTPAGSPPVIAKPRTMRTETAQPRPMRTETAQPRTMRTEAPPPRRVEQAPPVRRETSRARPAPRSTGDDARPLAPTMEIGDGMETQASIWDTKEFAASRANEADDMAAFKLVQAPTAREANATVLRAALASPSAARRAFVYREIFDQPLSLRMSGSGGHEDWR